MKKNIAVFFGGKSCEHDISIITGIQAVNNLAYDKYNIFPVYITHENKMKLVASVTAESVKKDAEAAPDVTVLTGGNTLYFIKKNKKLKPVAKLDCAVLAMHGMNGEDGTLQGLLRLSEIPFTSSNVLGSSLGMDKAVMKTLFKANGFNITEHIVLDRCEFKEAPESSLDKTEEALGYPVIVKPVNLGSSIGISACKDREELARAAAVAFEFDGRLIVEKFIKNLTELNCSAKGYKNKVGVSDLEQPISWESFLTFEEKYISNGTKNNDGLKGGALKRGGSNNRHASSMASLKRIFPANVAPNIEQEIKETSEKCFKAFDCKGVVRIDYILDNDTNTVYINEINTIPGSFSYYLWNKTSFSELLDELIEIAITEHKDYNGNTFTFSANVF